MKTRIVLITLLFALIFLSGCVKISYDAEQQFNEDGTSVLTVTEYVGVSDATMDSLDDFPSSTDASSITTQLMLEYYKSSAYSQFLCDLIEDSSVESCTAHNDGSVTATINLEPGDFYSFEKTTDWVSLKEKSKYTIDKVPLISYYAKKDNDDYEDLFQEDLVEYVEENIDTYLTEDIHCSASYPFECEFLSASTLEVSTSSYTPKRIQWIGCSDLESWDFFFMEEEEAKNATSNVIELNTTITSTSPLTVALSCPPNSQSIVVFYLQESYSGDMTSELDAFDIQTKEDIKQEILEGLETDTSSIDTTSSVSSSDTTDYFLNFKTSKFLTSTFEELSDLVSSSSYVKSEVEINYEASFPETAVNATIGAEKLALSDNTLELGLDDLETLPKGSLIVTTEKELSPLGIYTWAIPLLVFVAIVIVVILGLKK
ncbi:hypothetical protein KKB44_01075 [Candidatus Micrarchaeota archaeon]|nr:hypothetical protein [Candidatus Micrarchaeota archaeon]